MSGTIKILILEDTESDIFLIERQLKKGKLNYELKLTDNQQGFEEYLKSFEPDIILSDYYLPNFTGLDALKIVTKHSVYIPFIIITGALDEETAVSCIKAGADDYLTKEKLTRLVSAIISAIEKRDALDKKERAERKTKQLAKELQTLIQTVNTPIVGIDLKGNITDWNLASEKLTGYSKKEVLNLNFINTFINKSCHKDLNNIFNNAYKDLNSSNFEILLRGKSSNKKILLNTTTHKDDAGKTKGLIIIGQDITEMVDYREELEEKIEERTKELRIALENEKELNELKSRFVSMASHEFRTPLSAIGFAAGFLKKYIDKIDKEKINNKLDKINTQVKHITSLLDDILIIGKSDANIKFKPQLINFFNFLEPLLDEVYMGTKNSHEIRLLSKNEAIEIEIDPKLGRNIYINLLTNAIKFSPKQNHILFENYIKDGFLVSKITDFGIGIPEDELKTVFDPFHRAKNTEAIQGTGLGLPIVKEAVEAHGGTIEVKSIQNKETTFIVKIPIKQPKNNKNV